MEVLDLYDKDGNKLNKTILRGEKIPDNEFVKVVIIFMQNSDDNFLIQLTSKQKGSLWASTGGHVISGEDENDAIIREVKEELGIDLSNKSINCFDKYNNDNVIVYLYYINIDIDLKDVKMQKEEVSDAKYLNEIEIKNLIKNGMFRTTHKIAFFKCLSYLKKNI